MPRIASVSVEGRNAEGSTGAWKDALRTHIARLPPSAWQERVTCSVPNCCPDFAGRIESGALGESILAKVDTATPHHLGFTLQEAAPVHLPVVFLFQLSGSVRLRRQNSDCMLRPSDWTIIDSALPFTLSTLGAHNENFTLRLERPDDSDVLSLLNRSKSRRYTGFNGLSRILSATVAETFCQMNTLPNLSGSSLQRVLSALAWSAVREQLESPPSPDHHAIQRARIKTFIEGRLDDTDLTTAAIAEANAMSVRSLHRMFEDDAAGSISAFLWNSRLQRCAAELRDHAQASRSITDICFSWGFSSTSHFSRSFKARFGITLKKYREAAQSFEVEAAH